MSQRYFEDVEVGEQLPVREVVPTEDMAIDFFGRDNPTNPAFADAEHGKRLGVGGALVSGKMKMSWMTQFVGDWVGQEGRIAGMRVAFRRPDVAGRPLAFAGNVVDKRQEDGRNVVELEVVTIAPDGQPSMRGNMQVVLPSRP